MFPMNDDEQEKPAIEVQHITVDPVDAEWPPLLQYHSKWKYRVFFKKHPAAMANSLHLGELRYFLEDHCGIEEEHWITEACPEPTHHTVQGEDEETMKRGNCVYLTDLSWLMTMKLNADPNQEGMWSHITIIETRAGA